MNRYRIDNGSHNLDALKQFSGETPTPEDLELPDDFRNLKPMGHDYLQSNTTEFLAALWNVIGSKAPAAALIQHPFGGALIERFMCCNCNDVWWKPGFSMIPIESETGAMLDLTKPIPVSEITDTCILDACFQSFGVLRNYSCAIIAFVSDLESSIQKILKFNYLWKQQKRLHQD